MRLISSPSPRRPLAYSLARLSSAAAVCTVLSLAGAASGASLSWDTAPATVGAAGGTGAWNTTNNLWFNGTTNVSWNNGSLDTAVFGGLPGTVTPSEPITVGGLTFDVDGYGLDFGSGALTLGGTSPTITVTNTGHVAQITAELAGIAGLTKAGAGTLSLTGGLNPFTGAINITGGTLAYSFDEQLGAVTNSINLSNGSTLSYLGVSETTAGRIVNVGTGGGTIHSTGPYRMFNAGQLTGAGTLIRTGGSADGFDDPTLYSLDIRGDNSGFTGNVIVESSVLELQNSRALGNGSNPNQTITVNGGILSTSTTIPQKVILNGGTLSFNNNNTSSYSGPMVVQSDSKVELKDFYQFTGRTGRISGPLTGTGTLTVNSSTGTLQSLVLSGDSTQFGGKFVVTNSAILTGVVGVAGGTTTFGNADITLTADPNTPGLTGVPGGILRITPNIGTNVLSDQTAGLVGRYFNQGNTIHNGNTFNANYSLTPDAIRIDDDLNLRFMSVSGNRGTNEGTPGNIGTVNGANVENFAAIWNGLLNITTGGQYTFVNSSDDGSVVFIDGVQVITNEGGHDFPGGGNRSGTVTLTPGKHSITVKLVQGTGGAGVVLAYQGPDQPIALPNPFPKDGYNPATLIPASAFSNATIAGSVSNKITVPEGQTGGLDAAGLDLTSTGTITVGALGTINFGSSTGHKLIQAGNIVLQGDVTIGTQLSSAGNAANSEISGVISGNGNITTAGVGTLRLTGANTFTGDIIVGNRALIGNTTSLTRNISFFDSAATVIFDQANPGTYNAKINGDFGGSVVKIGSGSLTFTKGVGTPLSVNEGSVTLPTGLSEQSATVSVNSGGRLTIPNASAPVNVAGLTLNNGAAVDFTLGSTPSAFPALSSLETPSASGRAIVNVAGATGAGTYRLIDYGGSALTGPQFSGFTLGTVPIGSFYTALVNNRTNTSVDFVVENFGTLNTWTGATNGVWEATSANWANGAFANGQQVTFDDSGVNKTITGGPVAPQRITISNTSGNDYAIANSITGVVAGGLQKSGAGKATFTGDVSIAGPVTVSGGTLSLTNTSLTTPNNISGAVTIAAGAKVEAAFGGVRPLTPGESGTSALSGAPVDLAGGELVFTGNRYDDGTGGLTAQFYTQQIQRNARIEMASLSGITALFNTSTPETLSEPNAGYTNAIGNINFANSNFGSGAPFSSVGFTNTDNVMATWKGQFVAQTEGSYTFLGRSDDGLMVFIDGQLVINRNNFQGNGLTSNTVTLTAGAHDIYVSYYEGGGGSGVQLFRDADNTLIPLASLTAAQPMTNLGNNVTLSASSTIRASNTYGINLGSLTANTPGVTLTTGTTTSLDGLVRFANTSFGANGTYTFATNSDVALGTLSDGANGNVVISKTGAGNLILDSTGSIADADGTTIQVQAGRLVAQRTNTGNNPLGTAKIQLNGVDSVLQFNLTETTTGNAAFDNAIAVNENARIEFANHNTAGREIVLGSVANGISIASGKTLELVAMSNANPRINGVISGNADIRVTTGADAGNTQGVFLLNAANTFTGKLTIENGGFVRLDNPDAIKTAKFVDLRSNGRIEFFANNSFSTATPRILSQAGSFFRINAAANPGLAVGNGTLEIGPGRILEFQTANPLTGGGIVSRAPGSYLLFNTGTVYPAATTQVGLRASDTRPLDVIRANTTVTGNSFTDSGWGATTPGTIIQIFNGDRNISNTNIQVLNGQIITNDGTTRTMANGAGLEVSTLGGTIAASGSLVVAENIIMNDLSGKLTIGAHIPLDSRFSTGTVVFSNPDEGDFSGTTASTAKAIDVIGGSVLEGRADVDGSNGFGLVDFPTLGVNLARGTVRSLQPTANTTTAGTYSVSVGKVFATGAATLHVNRNTANAGVQTEMRLASSIVRSAGATIGIQSQNNILGGGERIRFNNNADAPSRLTLGGTATMVAPYIINVSNNLGSFVDYDNTQSTTDGPGFVNAAYSTVTAESGLTSGSIVDTTAAIALTGDRTVGAARLQAGLSGAFTLTSESGGFIVTSGSNVGQTISAKLAAPAGKELIVYSGGVTGGIHNLGGTLASDSGFIKFGPRTLTLSADNSATLFGDVTINESSLVVGADNRLGAPANRVVLNGGNLRPNANMTTAREIIVNAGGGQLTNDGNRNVDYAGVISGEGGLTINSVNGNNGVNRFTGTSANTFQGGLIVSNGVLEFTRDNQLGALPSTGDYDRGHIVINEGGGTNATLRLAAGAGTVSTGDRQFTLLGGNARIEVAGAEDTLEIANDIRGNGGGINKNGPGTLILSNPDGNGYTGNTLVNAGALLVNNTAFSGTGTGTVTVNPGAILGGSGIMEGAITVNGGSTLSPGSSLGAGITGELRSQNGLTLAADSIFRWSLGLESTASPGVNFDRFTLDNGVLSVAAGANLLFDFAPGAEPSGDAFWASSQTWSNVIQITSLATFDTHGEFDIDNTPWAAFGSFTAVPDVDGYDIHWSPVPEPSTGMALLTGLGSLLGLRRLRRRSLI